VLGSGRVTQKGALGGGKITHVLLLERGAWLRRGEGATNKRGAPQKGREGSRGLELVRMRV
jgi:hypothetical protein